MAHLDHGTPKISSDIHNGAAMLFHPLGIDLAADQEPAREVVGNDGIPAVGANILQARRKLSARIIDKPVDPTVPVQDSADLFADRRLVADIKDSMIGTPAVFFDFRRDSLQPGLRAIGYYNHRAKGGQLGRDASTDAAAAAGDNHDLMPEQVRPENRLVRHRFTLSRAHSATNGRAVNAFYGHTLARAYDEAHSAIHSQPIPVAIHRRKRGGRRAVPKGRPRGWDVHIYLPIAELSVNIFMVLSMGAGVGMLSGIFGVGGGFLMTPLLIFMGISPPVAVGTEANQILASSVSGVVAHWRRGNVDFKMGAVLLVGGLIGSTFGVWLFKELRDLGQIDLVIRLSYVIFLGIIGFLMLIESARALQRSRRTGGARRKLHQHNWLHGMPFKMRFRKSKLYISALLPLLIGIVVGILSAIMGVGGGFIMVPAMIYLLGMPTNVVVGTSLFQIIFVTANATFWQSSLNQTVDVVLAFLLLLGAVIGAQVGTVVGSKLKGEQLRGLLALIVLTVCAKIGYELVATPADLYSIGFTGGH